MARAEILIALDNHLSNGGKMHEFRTTYSSDNPSPDEVNVSFMIHLAQQLYINFPGKINPKGNEFIQRRVNEIEGLTTEHLLTISQSAATLLDFSSAGYVVPTFDHEKLPPKEGLVAPGWSFTFNLDRKEKRLGNINFEENFFETVTKDQSEGLRMQAAIYGAGSFLDLLDQMLGDMAHFTDVPDSRLIPLTTKCFMQAMNETVAFYGLLKLLEGKS